MKTWIYFLENKEKEEEKSGIDFDHDNENGEPLAHQNKVKAKHKEMLEFFAKRKEGARKIANSAKEKGGPSILTAWHFQAKDSQYREVIQAIQENKDESYFKSKWKSILNKLRNDMKQEQFQKTIGELEVWGEVIAQLFN